MYNLIKSDCDVYMHLSSQDSYRIWARSRRGEQKGGGLVVTYT